MEITFTRTGECTYTTRALRDDGVLLEVPAYDRTALLPHDIAHYLVEREFGLKRGFWGCIAAGAMFPGIKMISGRQPAHAAERSQTVIREAGQQGTEAEVLVGIMLHIMNKRIENDWPAVHKLLNESWQPSHPSRNSLSAAEVKQVCASLRETQQRWQALAIGESLTVTWPREKKMKR